MPFPAAYYYVWAHPLATPEWSAAAQAYSQMPYIPNQLYRLATLYRQAGQKAVARGLIDLTLPMDHRRVDSQWFRAHELIRRGDWQGWRDYGGRWADPAFRQGHDYDAVFAGRTAWDGVEDLSTQTLLVHYEQGHGDTIQMLRYLPWARRRCRELFVSVRPEMRALVEYAFRASVPAPDAIQPISLTNPAPMTDRHLGIMSLPGFAGPLAAAHCDLRLLRLRLHHETPWGANTPRRRIGIVYRGNPRQLNDAHRSMGRADVLLLVRALQEQGLIVYSFQRGDSAEWTDCEPRGQGDWFETATEMLDIHVIVSVDSAPMHLAAALGIPTIGLLCYDHDFRYPDAGDIPEWYPTLRLARQTAPGDWQSCIDEAMTYL